MDGGCDEAFIAHPAVNRQAELGHFHMAFLRDAGHAGVIVNGLEVVRVPSEIPIALSGIRYGAGSSEVSGRIIDAPSIIEIPNICSLTDD